MSRVLHSAVGDRAYLLQKNKSMIRSGESWRCVASKETKANEQMCAGSVRTNNVHRKWQNLVNILFFPRLVLPASVSPFPPPNYLRVTGLL